MYDKKKCPRACEPAVFAKNLLRLELNLYRDRRRSASWFFLQARESLIFQILGWLTTLSLRIMISGNGRPIKW